MEKRILVSLDASANAMRALEYVAQSFTFEYEITLFSVIPDTAALCEMTGFNISPTLAPYFLKKQGVFCALEDRKKALLKEAVNNAETALIEAGFDKKNIKKKIVEKRTCKDHCQRS